MGSEVAGLSVGAGFSPRIHPRPQYPSLIRTILAAFKEMFYQSGTVGLMLTVMLFPYFQSTVLLLRTQLGDAGSDRVVFSIIANSVHFCAYLFINGSFGIFDYFGFFQEYKLSRKPYMKPSKTLLINTLMQAAFGQIIINPVVLYYVYPSLISLGMYPLDAPLPDSATIFFTYCIAYLINGVGFYWAHRLFHAKALYAYFHKQHHEFTGSMGIAAEYANPVEQIFANLLPTLGGVIFRGTHPLIFCIWLVRRHKCIVVVYVTKMNCSQFLHLQQTYETHSGYCFKGTILDKIGLAHADGAAHHDYHHAVNTGNFGTEWMDWLFGTEDGFVAGGMHDGYVAKKNKSSNYLHNKSI